MRCCPHRARNSIRCGGCRCGIRIASCWHSHVADLVNAGASRHAGAITAALYLERFVPAGVPWLHLDLYAWNDSDRPGRPRGGEAQTLRACIAFLRQRYA